MLIPTHDGEQINRGWRIRQLIRQPYSHGHSSRYFLVTNGFGNPRRIQKKKTQSCDANFDYVDSPRGFARYFARCFARCVDVFVEALRKHPRNARGNVTRGQTGYHVLIPLGIRPEPPYGDKLTSHGVFYNCDMLHPGRRVVV